MAEIGDEFDVVLDDQEGLAGAVELGQRDDAVAAYRAAVKLDAKLSDVVYARNEARFSVKAVRRIEQFRALGGS